MQLNFKQENVSRTSQALIALLSVILTVACHAEPPADAPEGPEGMVWVEGGAFSMGSTHPLARRDESPIHRVKVDGFWIDKTEVTNAEFTRFVEATGYETTAERAPTIEEIMSQLPPGTPPPKQEDLVAASLVFACVAPGLGQTGTRAHAQWVGFSGWADFDCGDGELPGPGGEYPYSRTAKALHGRLRGH